MFSQGAVGLDGPKGDQVLVITTLLHPSLLHVSVSKLKICGAASGTCGRRRNIRRARRRGECSSRQKPPSDGRKVAERQLPAVKRSL